jgi:hypothetical protein
MNQFAVGFVQNRQLKEKTKELRCLFSLDIFFNWLQQPDISIEYIPFIASTNLKDF